MASSPWTVKKLVGLGLVLGATGWLGAGFLTAVKENVAKSRKQACSTLRPTKTSDHLAQILSEGGPPNIALPDRAGKTWNLSDFKGRPVLVNFWATWCPPCTEEVPTLSNLARQLGDDAVVLAVSVDESWDEIDAFFPESPHFSVLLDAEKQAAQTYGASKYPETFLIDADGQLQAFFVGPRKWDTPKLLPACAVPADRVGRTAKIWAGRSGVLCGVAAAVACLFPTAPQAEPKHHPHSRA